MIDNIARGGKAADVTSTGESATGVRHMNEIVSPEPRHFATAIQTAGTRGYDGFAMTMVMGETVRAARRRTMVRLRAIKPRQWFGAE